MKIGYLVNQYPKVSHSFIRREIQMLEKLGLEVCRLSIRPCPDRLVDDADRAELERTTVILSGGGVSLMAAVVRRLLAHPRKFLTALRLALAIGRGSDRGVGRHLVYLAEACVVHEWARRHDLQHVHAHFGTNSTTVAMLYHELGQTPYSFTVHGPEEFDKATILGLEQKIDRAAFVAAISEFGRSQLLRWCPYEQWSKVQIIRCGLDDSLLQHAQTPIQNHPQLVCVGRLCEQKGQMLLIEAIKRLVEDGVDVHLVLVGDGEMRGQVEAAIRRHDLSDRCLITGWASNERVQQYILDARALVLPSFAEGLPVVLQEAFALGRPVISTYVAGIPELVDPGVSGWLVPAGSLPALVAAMREALDTPVRRLEEMGRAGSERVKRQHSIAAEAGKLADLIQKAVAESQPQNKAAQTC